MISQNLKWYSPLLPGALPEEKSHEVTMHRLGYPGKMGIRNWKHLLLAEGHHQIGKKQTFYASNLTMSLQNVNPCEFFSLRGGWPLLALLGRGVKVGGWVALMWSAKSLCTKKRNMHKQCHVPIQRYHFDMQ